MQNSTDKREKTAYDHIVKYTGLFGGIQGISLLAAIVRNKVVAELLGPIGMGVISLYNHTGSLLNNATNFGISFSAVRHIAELYESGDEEQLRKFVQTVRLWSLATALLGILVCCLFSPLLSIYFEGKLDWLSFVCFSPVVGMTAITGGELAILKGTRRLRRVAIQSLINSVCSLFVSIPLYYLWGEAAIVWSLILVALSTMLTTVYFSIKCYPISLRFEIKSSYAGGKKMVSLGTAFILAGILGAGVEFLVRAYMMRTGSEADVGMYNAGYLLTVTYASMVFTAMETDFYPRLSAVNQDVALSNAVVNRQIEASVLLVAPMLVAMLVALPILLPLFYNEEFLPVIAMAECSIFSMYMRAVALPISYMSLAKGRSWVYLFTETVYDAVAVLMIVGGYAWGGLQGAGIALSLAATFDLLLVWLTARKVYGFRLWKKSFGVLALQLPFGALAFVITVTAEGLSYWLLGGLCFLCSAAISVHKLLKETTLLQTLWSKVVKRFGGIQ